MKKFVAFYERLKEGKRLTINGEMMTLTFFKLYTIYIKNEAN